MGQVEEKTFFSKGEVLVTNKRVVLGNNTYALKHITSLSKVVVRSGSKKLIFGINVSKALGWCWFGFLAVTLACYLYLSIKFNNFFDVDFLIDFFYMQSVSKYLFPAYVCFVTAFLMSIIWIFCPRDSSYWVVIESASDKKKSFLCHTQDEAQKLSDAINEAIINN